MRPAQMSDYMAAEEAAEILGVSIQTLRFWRYNRKHLDLLTPYVYVNKRVFYKREDVERFVEASMTAVA